MKLVLAAMLKTRTLELVDKAPVIPQRRGVTLGPKGGVKAIVTGTRSASAAKAMVTV